MKLNRLSSPFSWHSSVEVVWEHYWYTCTSYYRQSYHIVQLAQESSWLKWEFYQLSILYSDSHRWPSMQCSCPARSKFHTKWLSNTFKLSMYRLAWDFLQSMSSLVCLHAWLGTWSCGFLQFHKNIKHFDTYNTCSNWWYFGEKTPQSWTSANQENPCKICHLCNLR